MTTERREPVIHLDELTRDECITLLRTVRVGRIAVARDDDGPLVVPVNYTMDGDTIVFRSDAGAKLGLLRHRPVSFEVDVIDPFTRTGWSVLATGLAYEATSWEVGHVDLDTWGPGPKTHWVRIDARTITGRRIRREAEAYHRASYP